MKRSVFVLFMMWGMAGAQEAYVMPPGSNQAGDVIAREQLIYVLYTRAKCPLPIVNAEHMRRADIFNTRTPDIGCWGRTLSPQEGSVLIVGPTGATSAANLGAMVKARIEKDGSATITEPSPMLRDFRDRFPMTPRKD